jgi:hypothetical protein
MIRIGHGPYWPAGEPLDDWGQAQDVIHGKDGYIDIYDEDGPLNDESTEEL